MKNKVACLLFVFAILGVSLKINAQTMSSAKLLRHAVFFKFKNTATPEKVKNIEAAFHDLPSKIKTIKDFEWGMNNSPEKLNEGLTHAFFVTFTSEKDRDDYLVDPAHKAFVAFAEPYIEKAVVIDYWVQK